MVSTQNTTILRIRRLLGQGWRVLRGLLLTLLVVLVLVVAVLVLPAGRSGLLKVAMGQAHRFLPGELTVEEISWPGLGRLEFEGLVWRVAATDSLAGAAVGDTLAQVSQLAVEVDLEALRDRDLLVRQLTLTAGPVDVPTIMELFPVIVDTAAAAQPDTQAAYAFFLREGDLPMIPSVAVENFRVKIRDTKVDDTLTLKEAGLEATLEMRTGRGVFAHLGQGRVRLEMLRDELMVLNADQLDVAVSADCQKREFQLDSLFVRLPEAGPPAVRDAWLKADPVSLRVDGHGSWTDTGLSVVLEGQGALPGPDHVRPLLPKEFPEEISGCLMGGFQVEASVPDLAEPNPTGRVRLDFSDTSWLDHLLLVAAVDEGRATVDTLNLALWGTRLAFSGTVDSTEVDARLEAGMDDPALLHLLGGPALAGADASFDLQADLKGKWPLPDVNLDLVAAARTADLEVPALTASIRTRDRLAEVALNLEQGLTTGAVALDSLQLKWDGDLSRPDSLSHRFDLGVWSPLGTVALGATGIIDTLRTITLDSLVVVSLDSTMRTEHPATIIYGPGPRDLQVQDFDLKGSLGDIALDCSLDESGLTMQLVLDLLMQESFLMDVAPNEIWSNGGGTDLSIKANIDLEGGSEGPTFTGRARALLLPHRDDPEIGADLNFYLVRGDSSGLGADLNLHADATSLLKGSFRWPGSPDLETGKWIPDPAKGLEVHFPEQKFDLSQLNQVMPPDVALSGILDFKGEILEQTGNITQENSEQSQGFLLDALLGGHVGIKELEVNLPNRSRVALSIATNLEGTVSEPVITGEIEVKSGYIRIPELPRTLLDVEGESMLWLAMQEARAGDDSVNTAGPVQPDDLGPRLVDSKPPFIPELNVSLEMPGNMIVNGYGLNIELEGSLVATRGVDLEGTAMVVLKGHAGVRQGTLKFMNNVFNVEKADIRFNNTAPPNPHLDIQLDSDISGYIIYLKITGYADDPVVELTSEPDMNEADIIAVLLFGQPANDLDNDQRGRANEENDPGTQLRENLAALAVVFGGAGIQNQMSNTLGVDMVEMGSDSAGDSTIMVGKFITPKVLLKYNQSLEKSGTYFMTMEYRLSQYFKLISTYGQGEEASGLELKWTRRY